MRILNVTRRFEVESSSFLSVDAGTFQPESKRATVHRADVLALDPAIQPGENKAFYVHMRQVFAHTVPGEAALIRIDLVWQGQTLITLDNVPLNTFFTHGNTIDVKVGIIAPATSSDPNWIVTTAMQVTSDVANTQGETADVSFALSADVNAAMYLVISKATGSEDAGAAFAWRHTLVEQAPAIAGSPIPVEEG